MPLTMLQTKLYAPPIRPHLVQHPLLIARPHDAILHTLISAYHGIVFKRLGDGAHAVFSTAPDALAATLILALLVTGWRLPLALTSGIDQLPPIALVATRAPGW
jgi:class 3 adenylate cyclase